MRKISTVVGNEINEMTNIHILGIKIGNEMRILFSEVRKMKINGSNGIRKLFGASSISFNSINRFILKSAEIIGGLDLNIGLNIILDLKWL
jgi:hypothetical protein